MLTIRKIRAEARYGIRSDRRLWLTADRSRVVEDGDPDAAVLLCGIGQDLTPEDVSRYNLTVENGRVVSAPSHKKREPSANKSRG